MVTHAGEREGETSPSTRKKTRKQAMSVVVQKEKGKVITIRRLDQALGTVRAGETSRLYLSRVLPKWALIGVYAPIDGD